MNTRELGRTGIRVSEIGLGTWALGGPCRFGGVEIGWGEQASAVSEATIRAAAEAGITLIDTANLYGRGEAERLVGRALAGIRSRMVLVTRAGNVENDEGGWAKDFSAAHLTAACEASLARLQTDCVEVFLLHSPPLEQMGGRLPDDTLDGLDALRRAGKIRAAGVSVARIEDGAALLEHQEIGVLQLPYNLLLRDAERSLLPRARAAGVGVLVRSPLAEGFLARARRPSQPFADDDWRAYRYPPKARRSLERKVRRLSFLIRPDRTAAQAAIQFALAGPGVSCVVAGARTPDQVRENAAACDCPPLSNREVGRVPAG